MKRKLLAVLLLTALVVGGASAQLMFGVTGALPMDSTNFKVADVVNQLKEGNGVMYGFTGELAFRKLGFGISANTMSYPDYYFAMVRQIMDVDAYISFHIIKARAFLDPFVELGAGLIGTMNDDKTDQYAIFDDASMYWYAAAGLGVNLGIVGVFTKFSYNFKIQDPYTYTDMSGIETPYPAFGTVLFGNSYIPEYKLTVGAKIIL